MHDQGCAAVATLDNVTSYSGQTYNKNKPLLKWSEFHFNLNRNCDEVDLLAT